MSEEVVYFVAVRTAKPQGGAEIPAAMKALNESGLLAQPPLPVSHYAVAWYRPYSEMTANDFQHLRALGLSFEDANRIATAVTVDQTSKSEVTA
jgi:hypothetical protein